MEVRAIKLKNGDIFTIHQSLTVMFEDDLLHEVREDKSKIESHTTSQWIKTGLVFTPQGINALN